MDTRGEKDWEGESVAEWDALPLLLTDTEAVGRRGERVTALHTV